MQEIITEIKSRGLQLGKIIGYSHSEVEFALIRDKKTEMRLKIQVNPNYPQCNTNAVKVLSQINHPSICAPDEYFYVAPQEMMAPEKKEPIQSVLCSISKHKKQHYYPVAYDSFEYWKPQEKLEFLIALTEAVKILQEHKICHSRLEGFSNICIAPGRKPVLRGFDHVNFFGNSDTDQRAIEHHYTMHGGLYNEYVLNYGLSKEEEYDKEVRQYIRSGEGFILQGVGKLPSTLEEKLKVFNLLKKATFRERS